MTTFTQYHEVKVVGHTPMTMPVWLKHYWNHSMGEPLHVQPMNIITCVQVNSLVQDYSNSSALAMELL